MSIKIKGNYWVPSGPTCYYEGAFHGPGMTTPMKCDALEFMTDHCQAFGKRGVGVKLLHEGGAPLKCAECAAEIDLESELNLKCPDTERDELFKMDYPDAGLDASTASGEHPLMAEILKECFIEVEDSAATFQYKLRFYAPKWGDDTLDSIADVIDEYEEERYESRAVIIGHVFVAAVTAVAFLFIGWLIWG